MGDETFFSFCDVHYELARTFVIQLQFLGVIRNIGVYP